jgi:hypothetical protein
MSLENQVDTELGMALRDGLVCVLPLPQYRASNRRVESINRQVRDHGNRATSLDIGLAGAQACPGLKIG